MDDRDKDSRDRDRDRERQGRKGGIRVRTGGREDMDKGMGRVRRQWEHGASQVC
jgi:hypothetical protein